ncbi:hypothetical protein EVAR_83954_1 [Eumeta japonica]|uniref:Uncharacterized protein n=1 Tax=Eumeta variegata TaxID=151549 RepID=A0A4C1VR01_EUMVA|nr:hypothetical protein EVAR_83954_1 [Eumeta japonica]
MQIVASTRVQEVLKLPIDSLQTSTCDIQYTEHIDSFALLAVRDETWIYCYTPEIKQQASAWVFEDDSTPTTLRQARSAAYFTLHVNRFIYELRKTFRVPHIVQRVALTPRYDAYSSALRRKSPALLLRSFSITQTHIK